jgi:hypothetical protein
MKKIPDLSIVIVSHNTRNLLKNCLESVSENRGITCQIIVIDNGSVDGSAAMVRKLFPRVILLINRENTGFTKASNAGIRVANGRYILLLNSDTEISPDVLSKIVAYMDNNKLEVATAKLVLPDGQLDPACHRGFPTPWAAFSYTFKLEKLFPKSRIFGGYHLGYLGFETVHEIDCPSGAFFLVKKEVIDNVGLLDETYFMYAEDIDWAWRIKKQGFRIWYLPQFTVLHRKKQSGRANANFQKRRLATLLFYENNLRFYQKHYQNLYPQPVSFFVKLFYFIRMAIVKSLGI